METPGGAREVAKMAWPLAVGMLSYTLMMLVDTFLMGHVSTTAQAGVAVAAVTVAALRAVFRGVASGAQAIVAAAHGARDDARVLAAASAAAWLGAGYGLVGAALIAGVAVPLAPALLVDAPVADAASTYMAIVGAGLPFSMASIGLMAGIQGVGETRVHMVVSVAANVVNAVLGAALVFGWGPLPALGVAGAAWATVAGGLVMFALFGLRFAQRFGRPVWPDREVVQSALSMGVPSALQHLGHMSAFIVMNVALARAGEVELAASQIVLHIASASFLPGAGIADAGGILVGRYLGAGRTGDADRALRSARWLALGLMGAASVAFATFGAEIASVFTRDSDVVARSGTLMLYAASFQVFDAAAMVQMAALRAVGDTRFCFALVAGSSWLFQVPSTLLLGVVLGWGAEGAWLGLTLMVLVEAVVSGARVTRMREGRLGRLDLLLGRAA